MAIGAIHWLIHRTSVPLLSGVPRQARPTFTVVALVAFLLLLFPASALSLLALQSREFLLSYQPAQRVWVFALLKDTAGLSQNSARNTSGNKARRNVLLVAGLAFNLQKT